MSGEKNPNGVPKSALETAEEVGKLLINTRVKRIRPLVPPQILQEDYPLCVSHPFSVPHRTPWSD